MVRIANKCKEARVNRKNLIEQKRLHGRKRNSFSSLNNLCESSTSKSSHASNTEGNKFKLARQLRKFIMQQRRNRSKQKSSKKVLVEQHETPIPSSSSGFNVEFSNVGGPTQFCEDCGAYVWCQERVQKQKYKKPKYSICCQKGKIVLPQLSTPPLYLLSLLTIGGGIRSSKFREHIRAYNSMFAFTSMGGHVDKSINDGRGPYVFRLNGQNHHKIGSLLPIEGEPPRFVQLYIYDIENEVSNRISAVTKQKQHEKTKIDPEIVKNLARMIDDHNPLARTFRMAKERFNEDDLHPVRIQLIASRSKDGRQYNLPTSDEIAALIVGDGKHEKGQRDIVVDMKGVGLQRITELHPSFMAMQYPLLFPYAEDGFRTDIPHKDAETTNKRKRKKVTIREYYAYRLQQRPNESHILLTSGKLSQQFIVDAFTCIESTRLDYIRSDQKKFRHAIIRGLEDAVSKGHK